MTCVYLLPMELLLLLLPPHVVCLCLLVSGREREGTREREGEREGEKEQAREGVREGVREGEKERVREGGRSEKGREGAMGVSIIGIDIII